MTGFLAVAYLIFGGYIFSASSVMTVTNFHWIWIFVGMKMMDAS